MVVDDDGIKSTEYWRLDPDRTIRFESDEEYAERFRELFEEAVRCRLRTVGPVGATLSGGLDSSSNVSMACHLAEKGYYDDDVHTFSAVFDAERTPSSDEREFIEAATEQLDVIPHRIRGDRHSPLEDIDEVFWYNESPSIGSHFYLHWNIYRQAGENGVRVLLDGLGGDTTVSHGFGYLPELAVRGRVITLAREVKRLNERFRRSVSLKWLVRYQLIGALAPKSLKRGWHRVRNRGFLDRTNPALDEGFVERIDFRDRFDDERLSKTRTERDRHEDLITGGPIPVHTERWNKTAMRFDVEPRYPFFDRRLMEYCLALPPEQKLHDGWTRLVLRRAMDGILPRKIQWRGGKGHMGAAFWTALRDHAQTDVEDALGKENPLIEQYLNVEHLQQEAEEFAAGGRSGMNMLWFPVLLERWLSDPPEQLS
jgi:asparagine synthase (glutamine-hydrolysing)